MSAPSRSHVIACFGLALFTFSFLGGEFLFDTAMGKVTSAQGVVAAESAILGACAAGFLLFSPVKRVSERKPKLLVALFVLAVVVYAGMVVLAQSPASAAQMLSVGCAAFVLLGIMGGAIHFMAAIAFRRSAFTARAVGIAYALGLLLQFTFNTLVQNAVAGGIALVLATAVLALFLFLGRSALEDAGAGTGVEFDSADASVIGGVDALGNGGASESVIERDSAPDRNGADNPAPPIAKRETTFLLLTVVLIACVFCTLNNAVTLAHAQGIISVETQPRLLLAASGVAAGFLFDACKRKHMPIIMLCVTILSVLSILAMLAGFSDLLGLVIFYLASGFFVVFFTTSFFDAAPRSNRPALWAGMGRTANNVCATVVAAPSLALVQSGSVMAVATMACVLFVVITLVVYNLSALQAQAQEPVETLSPEQRFEQFCEQYQLTPRERDVLDMVCHDERTLKELSGEMGISQRMLQRHLTSIYRKTGTQSRAGLTSLLLK